jgi:hypothetical protein
VKQPGIDRSHGGLRGVDLNRSSILFSGPFGRIFRAVPPADFGPDDATSLKNLYDLAAAMTSVADPKDPKDGPDAEESGIPAAYTYLGQFIDHDLTFDPASSLQKQNDPDALVNFRTPRFDLDNIYGRGPDDQPYLYNNDGRTFVLGSQLTGAPDVNPRARDLQRNSPADMRGLPKNPARALIGDPRNDENVIVSQLQGLFHRFHNKIASDHPSWIFPRVQQEVRFHYQWMLLHDFLPTLISADVIKDVLPVAKDGRLVIDKANLKFFHYRDNAFMPLEFSAAAYRFGHSMIRPGYRLSDAVKPVPIFALGDDAVDLRGFKPPHSDWAIDWRRFVDIEPLHYGTLTDNPDQNDLHNQKRLQLAYKIDTSLVNPLGVLPKSVAFNPSVLAQRNLERGWRMRLPSGQDVARAMGIVPLRDKEILIGKFTGDDTDIVSPIAKLADGTAFVGNCPLWAYILAETVESTIVVKTLDGDKPIKTRKLGPVGGRIVAETFVGILLADSHSMLSLNPLWEPSLKINGVFGLRELILRALEG